MIPQAVGVLYVMAMVEAVPRLLTTTTWSNEGVIATKRIVGR
jgi:hypothetical protein